MVRPWKPPPKAMTPERPVWARAILMAFSTASAPVLNRAVFFGPAMGARALMRSISATPLSYGTIWYEVWVKRSSCAWMAATTFGWRWPVLSTAMPAAKSVKARPSTSQMVAFSARSA